MKLPRATAWGLCGPTSELPKKMRRTFPRTFFGIVPLAAVLAIARGVIDTQYYDLLGVRPSASEKEIRKGFNKLGEAHITTSQRAQLLSGHRNVSNYGAHA